MAEPASYDLKLDRAEKHLIELEDVIDRYVSRHAYEVSVEIEGGKGPVHLFRFTEQPDPMVAIIVGDFIYNVRSALDHLRAALVPKSRERSGYFPIYFPGVWEPAVAGEDTQRADERSRWKTDTRGMEPGAIKILQQLQREADSGDTESPPPLTAINRIAMKDRHTRVPVVAAALLNPTSTCRTPDGIMHALRGLGDREGVHDGRELPVPPGAMDVTIEGTPAVMVRVTSEEYGIRIPDAFRQAILPATRQVVDMLRPYVLRSD